MKELEAQLERKTSMQNQSEKQALQLSDRLKGREEICSGLQQKVKELETKLKEQQQSESASYQQKVTYDTPFFFSSNNPFYDCILCVCVCLLYI